MRLAASTAGSTWPARRLDVTDLDGIEEAFERLRRGEGARTIVIVDEQLAGHR